MLLLAAGAGCCCCGCCCCGCCIINCCCTVTSSAWGSCSRASRRLVNWLLVHRNAFNKNKCCLLYTSDAADE
eukprot:4531835-Heterocapsa_arctica.AAC.1